MQSRLRAVSTPAMFFALAIGVAILTVLGLCALPHDRYVRFNSLSAPEVVKIGWIYERIHFDAHPIDIAFVGTSHTVYGVNSAQVESTCRKEEGEFCSTVNFGVEHLGRNLHWLLTRELLASRTPRLLVVEVQESELRALHPAAPYLVEVEDLVEAPMLINLNYFSDLARLPSRQVSLFAKTYVPKLFDAKVEFDRSAYPGPHWDDTYADRAAMRLQRGKVDPRTTIVSSEELERQHLAWVDKESAKLSLPAFARHWETRANLVYLHKLLELARSKNVPVKFLYIPSYHGLSRPALAQHYAEYAPIWYPPAGLLGNANFWQDGNHLNYFGATQLSSWLGQKLAHKSDMRQ